MNSKTWNGGYLGYAVNQDLFENSTMVKSSGRISLMETESPSGTNYVVVLDYGEVSSEIVFPTPENPSRSGSKRVTKSASEAFAKFDELVAVYGGISSDATGITGRANSFEELDTYLLSMATLPEDIIVELQRNGLSSVGKQKVVLELNYSSGPLSALVGKSKDGLRMARLYYESFPVEYRIAGLKDLRPSIMERYMAGDLISTLIMTNKEKRKIYQQQMFSERYQNVPMSTALNNLQTVASNPLIALQVRFIDQKGNEVRGLPYEIACRGSLNFIEAAKQTNFGSSPGDFSSGRTLIESGMSGMSADSSQANPGSLIENWEGRSLSPDEYYHLLFKYRTDGGNGLPPGSVKVSVTTPRNTNSLQDWGNSRLRVYPTPSNASEAREGTPIGAQAKMLLYSHNFRLQKNDGSQRLILNIPVFVEPLPMHLVEMPAGSGNVISKWSITEDIGAIPSHQKINLSFKVLRPTASNKWEEADQILPASRIGFDDKILQYDEFTSPAGRSAYRESITDASPVEGIKFALVPENSNTWVSSKSVVILSPDFTGAMQAEITPGVYRLKMLVQIKADGTTGLRSVTQGHPEYALASRYDSFDSNMKSAIQQKYPELSISRGTMFAPETIDIGIIEAPAGFFYREVSERDTTPVGAVGVKLTKTGSLADLGTSRFKQFKLEQNIPPLLKGAEAEAGSIYDMMGVDYPSIDSGWPTKESDTDARFFDSVTIYLAPDSTIDLSMLQAFEQRYEAQRDGGSNVKSRLIAPGVGQSVEYNGFTIEHVLFDTSVGPELKNTEAAFSGAIHEYDMGKITTPFFEVGVLRAMVFYPTSGTMRRKMVVPGSRNVNPSLVVSARHAGSQWNPTQASMDRVFYFDVKSSAEGAALSGRWVPLESMGEFSMSYAPENLAFQNILDAIKRGGLPIRNSPKWNQFWSTTGDGWLFGGNEPTGGDSSAILDPSEATGGVSNLTSPPVSMPLSAGVGVGGQFQNLGSIGKLEDEGGLYDALIAPTPDYGEFDEDMGFVEG